MKTLMRMMTLVAMLGMLYAPAAEGRSKTAKRPLIQMAILLDTSSSMDGLIGQAKSQLWKVVNEFVASKKGGERPELQVALYEYGKDSLPAGEVSEELFALRTNGGSEHCGQVIQQATQGLDWSKSSGDLKVIFIAGNEPFTQGPVDYRKAVKAAITRGIIVNTIHCGSEADGISGKWKDGAVLADGSFMNIDQNRAVPHIAAPQDKQIAELGEEMNKTYIPYGKSGRASAARQKKQDANAESAAPGAMTQRAVYKSSGNYDNAGWDLVDAEKNGVKMEEVKAEELPENMRKMSVKERKAYVETQSKKRAEIQKKIQKLNEERKKYVADKQAELAKSNDKDTLDQAMIKSAREQAKRKNFKFE
jgi:hypothetical protein